MGIAIDQAEVERAIRTLAEMRGQSPEDIVGEVMLRELSAEMDRRERQSRSDDLMSRLRDAQRYFAAAPILDPRPYRDILYDEDGLPK